eukprot:14332638-Alexandrium_andersonii.AAC.1
MEIPPELPQPLKQLLIPQTIVRCRGGSPAEGLQRFKRPTLSSCFEQLPAFPLRAVTASGLARKVPPAHR